MEVLRQYHYNMLRHVRMEFVRGLYHKIHWQQRMLAIKGPRGAGKTTLMLQRLVREHGVDNEQALYLTADFHWFYSHSLFETTQEFYQNGGRYLYMDEVHKYPHWSRELKNIYDAFPDLRVVFSASSALDIYRGEADLSRRVMTYELPGLSFREYLWFVRKKSFPVLSLEEILSHHARLSGQVVEELPPLPLFRQYLKTGYLPIISEVPEAEVAPRLAQIINNILDHDLAYIEGYTPATAHKVKKLLGLLADSSPFKPNIAAIARKLDVSRDSIYAWFEHLHKARLINLLHRAGKGSSLLQKPDKLYLENTNLAYTLKSTPDIGSVRETFLFNQLVNSYIEVGLPAKGDFLLHQNTVLEVGGKNKKKEQIQDVENAYLVKDDIEYGFGRTIPLWLFGFLY